MITTTVSELKGALLSEAIRMHMAIDPLGPSVNVRTFADVFLALDVSEANRALALGANTRVVAEILAARKLARVCGASPVRAAAEQLAVDNLRRRVRESRTTMPQPEAAHVHEARHVRRSRRR